jgi:hypothetical protein
MESMLSDIQSIIQNQQGVAFLAVFIAGLISAASPCVLAAIPLIIGYVGGYSEGSKKKAALYSLVFILGLSITFTLLGAAASLMGGFFSFMGRWLYAGLAAIAVVMGLQLMGLISIPLPFQKMRTVKSKGLWGAFLLGLLTGRDPRLCLDSGRYSVRRFTSLYVRRGALCADLRRRSLHRADGKHRELERDQELFTVLEAVQRSVAHGRGALSGSDKLVGGRLWTR